MLPMHAVLEVTLAKDQMETTSEPTLKAATIASALSVSAEKSLLRFKSKPVSIVSCTLEGRSLKLPVFEYKLDREICIAH
jgi:hypothetical protein